MAQLVSIDFSSALSVDFNGATSVGDITGGDLSFTGEGFILTKTSLGTGDKWIRFQIPSLNTTENLLFAIGDSSGNLQGWTFVVGGGQLRIEHSSAYSTYTSWDNDENSIGATIGAFSAGQYIGVTFAPATSTLRVWMDVSAAAPTAVDSWDGGAADLTSTVATFVANSNYAGFGCWTGDGTGTNAVDNLTAGDFSAASSIDQLAFRFRNDDGDESSATPAVNENANLTAEAGTKRVRVQLNNTGNPAAITPQWEWRINAGTWRKIR